MAKIQMIRDEKLNGETYIRIYVDEKLIETFLEQPEAEKCYQECIEKLRAEKKYPITTILKSETI